MRGNEERALNLGRDFPERWGVPVGSRFSPERRQWILNQIKADGSDRNRLLDRAAEARARTYEAEAAGRLALEASFLLDDEVSTR